MREELMKRGSTEGSTEEQEAELKTLAALPDDRIGTSAIPEVLGWSNARRGLFYRPVKNRSHCGWMPTW